MGLMRFSVKLWVREMTKFGLSDLVKTVDSKFGPTLTVKLEFTGMVLKCDYGETVTVLGLFNQE